MRAGQRIAASVALLATWAPRASADDTTPPASTSETAGEPTRAAIDRLDLSVPDLPAMVDLNLSTDKVTRPTTPRELATSVANGLSPDGSYHTGIALEVSPFGLANFESTPARALRISLATAAINVGSSGGSTASGKAALGVRWSIGGYDPRDEKAGGPLRACLTRHLPRSLSVPPDRGPLRESGVTDHPPDPTTAAAAKEIDAELQHCRDQARAEHLAQRALEVAAVIDGTSEGSLQLGDLGSPHASIWVTGSPFVINSYASSAHPEPARHEDALLANYRREDGQALNRAFGFQPTAMVRADFTRMMAGWKRDLFAGVRLPVEWNWIGGFAEAGITLGDLSKLQDTSVQKTLRLGAGFDVRISDGSWLGVYAGQDFGDGAESFSLLSNVKFQLGERRQYGLR